MLSHIRSKGLLWAAVATVLGVAFLIGLGTWQMKRLAWKQSLIGAIAERSRSPALAPDQTANLKCSMVDSVGLVASCEYVRVRVRGVFDHSQERHVFAGVQNLGTGPVPGYWVFTPFLPSGAGAIGSNRRQVLVNRGFVPEAFKAPDTRSAGQTPGEVEIVAQIRTRQLRRWFDGGNMPDKNIYFVRDPRELGISYPKQLNNVPMLGAGYFYLEVVEGEAKGGLPKPLAGSVELPNRHFEYALTWYGLAAALVAVFVAFAVSRWRQPGSKPPGA